MRGVVLVMLLTACGKDGGSQPIDAPMPIDMPPDMPLIDAPDPPAGTHRYVVDKQSVPTNNQQARDFGLDLSGDLAVDNQFGMVLAVLAGMGIDVQGPTTTAIDRGQVVMLGELVANDFTNGLATFTMLRGSDPEPPPCADANDTTCRHHLQGTATFHLDAMSPHDTVLAGSISNGVLSAGPGHIGVQFVMGPAAPIAVTLIGARVKLQMLSDGKIGSGILAGALDQTEIDGKVIPGMAANAMAVVMRDCTNLASPPTCGCAANSAGKTNIDLFDSAPRDCAITADEIKASPFIQSILAPDLTIEGKQALSLGFAVTFTKAALFP